MSRTKKLFETYSNLGYIVISNPLNKPAETTLNALEQFYGNYKDVEHSENQCLVFTSGQIACGLTEGLKPGKISGICPSLKKQAIYFCNCTSSPEDSEESDSELGE